ncbi:hypothetical protein [Streptomyces sp. 4F14]|uniref:hypothetical protein n=1 Tax=Streptomyces sp. 4F14 TaxID=3394380 RepID=UPI003A839ED2
MQARPQGSGGLDLAKSADALAGWLLDQIGNRLHAPAEMSGTEELALAWDTVRSNPGPLSVETEEEWGRVESFMGFSGFCWFLSSTFIALLFLITPTTGWVGASAGAAVLIGASLTTGLTVTRLAVHYMAKAAISRGHASDRRIRAAAFLLRSSAVLTVSVVAAGILYLPFGR